MVDLLELYRIDELKTGEEYPRVDENPFDSERKLMSIPHVIDRKNRLLLKGACDEILKEATYIQTEQGIRDITEDDREHIPRMNHTFADNGFRVLGFATWLVEKDHIEVEDENRLTFLGLIPLMDPPRGKSRAAIENYQRAGIILVMITGDHKVTTRSIVRALGIYKSGNRCMDGTELSTMSEGGLTSRLKHTRVYACVAPEYKIRIVDTWQKKGKIMVMTGDSVNGAPALKQADIDIAVGITGTEVGKDAASMILTGGNSATIVKAIATGGNTYANVKSAIIYLLFSSLSGTICVLVASLLSLQVPFLSMYLLFINLATDFLPTIAIGMERSTKDILKEKPCNSSVGILTPVTMKQLGAQGILIATVTTSAYFLGLKESQATAATVALLTLCLSRLFHGFNCCSQHPLYRASPFISEHSILAFVIGFCFLNVILLRQSLHSLFLATTTTMAQLFAIYGPALIPAALIQPDRMLRYRQ